MKALRAAAESSSLESFKDWPGRGFLVGFRTQTLHGSPDI